MSPEESIVKSAVHAWNQQLERADKLFTGLSEQQLLVEVAPGKNRLIYLWGHLIAVHDAMLPLLGLGRRRHPELDALFVTGADRTAPQLPAAADLKRLWDDVSDTLQAGFNRYTPADWAGKHTVVSDEDFAANPLRNRLAILLSRTSHVAYHLGQAQLAVK
jgi:hypothetical protein